MATAQRKSLPAASIAHLRQLDSGGLSGAHPTGQLLWLLPTTRSHRGQEASGKHEGRAGSLQRSLQATGESRAQRCLSQKHGAGCRVAG